MQTVIVSTVRLQREIYFMAGLFQKLRMTIDERGAYARVVFRASSRIGTGMIALEGRIDRSGADNPRPGGLTINADDQRPWDLTINAKDLRDAVLAISYRSPGTRLSGLGRGLLIQSEADEAECATILLGHERQ